jgi:hypothetical protein
VPYIVTQYSSGMSLQKRLHEQGPLELKEMLRIPIKGKANERESLEGKS